MLTLLIALLLNVTPTQIDTTDSYDKFRAILEDIEEHPEKYNVDGSFGPLGNYALSQGVPKGSSAKSYTIEEAVKRHKQERRESIIRVLYRIGITICIAAFCYGIYRLILYIRKTPKKPRRKRTKIVINIQE